MQNKEKHKEYNKIWREKNKEYFKEYSKKRREESPEYERQRHNKWREKIQIKLKNIIHNMPKL